MVWVPIHEVRRQHIAAARHERAVDQGIGHAQEDVYSVLGLVARHSLLTELRARLLSQFVGRERELTMLRDLLGQVTEGRGQVIRLVGEPGVGKSRLLYEFRRGLLGQSVTYLEGRCLSYGSTIPYGPVLDLLRDNCGITETESPEVIMASRRVQVPPAVGTQRPCGTTWDD